MVINASHHIQSTLQKPHFHVNSTAPKKEKTLAAQQQLHIRITIAPSIHIQFFSARSNVRDCNSILWKTFASANILEYYSLPGSLAFSLSLSRVFLVLAVYFVFLGFMWILPQQTRLNVVCFSFDQSTFACRSLCAVSPRSLTTYHSYSINFARKPKPTCLDSKSLDWLHIAFFSSAYSIICIYFLVKV